MAAIEMQHLGHCEEVVAPNLGRTASNRHEVHISPDELETMNFRMLSSSEKPHSKRFIIPREIPIDLLRIRVIFTRLREQTRRSTNSGGSMELSNDSDDKVPIEAFQRAFERMFFLLSDPLGFDAKDYDENSDGFVSWGEFFHVYKKRNIKIKLSIFERVYLTFDDPDSSHLAQIVSVVVLLTIILSSLSFIVGTLPECQFQDPPLSEPKPSREFELLENMCLILFILEYVARLVTVWDVRHEIFDNDRMVDLIIGYEPLQHSSPAMRLLRFIFAPSNVIDLAAILPACLALVLDQGGGGFVVLRLIRLTRIFRAFKNPALAEPVIVISQTISQSTKALYVLVFNLLLGIVIFGSLMYLAEGQGRWSVDAQAFERKVGRVWNATALGWEDVWETSPFQSIPHTFWWAIVTATTVGYGDHSPTTSTGKIVAVLTMIFSLVILALPVGVIGGTFSQVWDDYKRERKNAAMLRQREMVFITSAIQRLDPTRMSRLMLIEVWNDQEGDEGYRCRPAPARFMGEVTVELDLPLDQPVTRVKKMRLEQNGDLVKRTITGSITVKYEWTPSRSFSAALRDENGLVAVQKVDSAFELYGTLKVTLHSAEGLVNLDFTRKNGSSSPYCMVLLYPVSPENGELRPCVWRSPTEKSSLSPHWEARNTFEFAWAKSKTNHEQVTLGGPRGSWTQESAGSAEPMTHIHGGAKRSSIGQSNPASLHEVLTLLRDLGADLGQVRQEVRSLSNRVDRLSHIEPPAANESSEQQSSAPKGRRSEHPVLLPNWVPPPE